MLWKEEGPKQDFLLALLKLFCRSQVISDAQIPDTPLLCCRQVIIVQRDWNNKKHNLDSSAFYQPNGNIEYVLCLRFLDCFLCFSAKIIG